MASVISNYWGNKILADYFTKYGAWIALHDNDPTVLADPSTEIAGGGYTRQKATFSAASSKTVASTNKLIFAALPTTVLTYLSLWDQQFSGNMYCAIVLGTSLTVPASSHVIAGAGTIAVTL